MAEKDKDQEQQAPLVNVDDFVKVISGKEKGEKAKVIAVYTNSIAVELDKMQKDGTLARTVLSHKEYKVE